MCIQTAIQQKIAELTNSGETIAAFLVETVHGQSGSDIKMHHRMEAARLISKYGIAQPDNITPIRPNAHATQNPVHPAPVHPISSQPTLHDIIAFPLARHIRELTDDGETLIRSLCEIMEGDKYNPHRLEYERAQTIQDRHRIAAARELLRRAFGERKASRRGAAVSEPITKLDENDSLNSRIANLVRDLTNDGIEAADFLVRIAGNSRYDGNWLPDHRLTAIKELLHRAYDLNYDAVTWEHINAYNRARDAATDYEAIHSERARIHAGRFVLSLDFEKAYQACDKAAMQKGEAKIRAYNRYINEDGEEPERALLHALRGADDPDPDFDHYYAPLTDEQQACFERGIAEYYATLDTVDRPQAESAESAESAAQVHTPKLTIPINNRSP